MALFHRPAPVDYAAQLRAEHCPPCNSVSNCFPVAFKDFLSSFKSSYSATEASASNALAGLNLDEDDDYDFMEDAPEEGGRGGAPGNRSQEAGKRKYIDMLQKVSDRQISEVCIELDDLDVVSARYEANRFLD